MNANPDSLYFVGGCVVAFAMLKILRLSLAQFRAWRNQRRIDKAWAARPKAPVRKIGVVKVDCMGQTHFIDFHFEATRGVPMYQHGPNGEFAIMGWEQRELQEFAQRRAEFE